MRKQKSKRYNKHSRKSQRSRRPLKREKTREKRKARGITKTLKNWFSGRKASPGTPLRIRQIRAQERARDDNLRKKLNILTMKYSPPPKYEYYTPSEKEELKHRRAVLEAWTEYHTARIERQNNSLLSL